GRLTEADWRLFTTLVRFDPVYVGHFKCNLRRIADYPNLSNYLRELFQVKGVAETVNLHHIKAHYYGSHATINPTRIVLLGPEIDYMDPHNRNLLANAEMSPRYHSVLTGAPSNISASRRRVPAVIPFGRSASMKKRDSAIPLSGWRCPSWRKRVTR